MLFLVPFLCRVSALLFLNDGATCRQHSLRPFSHHQHKAVTWSRQRLVFGVHWCCAASVKDSKRAMMSTFPPSCSRGQKFFPMTSRRQQQPSFAFPNRGIKRDRSQTIRAAPGSFAAAEPPPWQRWLLPWQPSVTVSDSTILRVICVELIDSEVP